MMHQVDLVTCPSAVVVTGNIRSAPEPLAIRLAELSR